MIRVTPVVLVATLLIGPVSGCSGDQTSAESSPSSTSGPASSSTTQAADDGPYQPTDEDRAAIRELLDQRASSLTGGARNDFLATIDTTDQDFVRRQKTLFDNLQRLPVVRVDYSVDDGSGYPPAHLDGGDPVFRPAVLEQVQLEVDEQAVTNGLEDTFVKRDGEWLLGAESVPGEYHDEREPQSRPWAGEVPIAVARSGALVMVVDLSQESSARTLARKMAEHIRFAADALGVDPSYDVLVDATTVGDVSKLNTVDDAEAAAITRPVLHYGANGPSSLAGVRIKVNPDSAVQTVADALVMRHELTHYLTLERLAGAPTWLKEGLAEWVTTAPAGLDELVAPAALIRHTQQVDHRLPTTGRWGLDPRADYLIGRAAVTYLVQTFGVDRVFAMGAAYSRMSGDDPDVKTDKVLERVVGISEAALVRETWAGIGSLHTG